MASSSSSSPCQQRHPVEIQRLELMHCYVKWERYDDAQSLGLTLLASLSAKTKAKGRVVPELRKHNHHKDTALLILEVVVTLVQCVANARTKDEQDYHRLISMVNQLQPWLRVIGVDGYEKLYKMLLSYMSKCALFLVGEHASFDVNLTHKFFVETFSEYKRLFLNECIKFLSEAISTMSDMYEKDKEACGSANLLATAYCLRALSAQEAEPNSKLYVQDIGCALKLWLNEDHSQFIKHTDMVSHNTFILLYHVGDLLSLKGNMEFHPEIYELIIRFFTCKKHVSVKECLVMLWQSKSLSHGLCMSDVDDSFILTFSKHCNLFQSLEFWKSCMENIKSLEVGFQQCFSVISTLSSPSTCSRDHAAECTHVTIDDIKKCASDLSNTNDVPLASRSLFLSANLYYGLSERMILKGSMIEAFFAGEEAYRLRVKLFREYFTCSTEKHKEIIGDNGEIIQKQGYGLKSFGMHSSVATTCLYDKGSSDIDFILTPWNVLRCYLESTLQVATIHEILGNGSQAESFLQLGKNISYFQGLPVFLVSFSIALGKVYRKQHHWYLAEKELESARAVLFDNHNHISCLKCKLVLEVTLNQQFGDLFRSRFYSKDDDRSKGLTESEHFYRSAIEKLKLSEWKNCVSNPKETSSRNMMFCDTVLNDGKDVNVSSDCGNHEKLKAVRPKATGNSKKAAKVLPQEQKLTSRITRSSKLKNESFQNELKWRHKSSVDCIVSCKCEVTCVFDEANCWHCVPFGVMKSSSLTSVMKMKWECIRRRFLLKLFIGTGKCLSARGDTDGALKVFLESISVLVNRSTFYPSKFKISFTFLAELVNKNVISDAFAIEHAALLYNICWFSLRSSCGNGARNHSCDIPIPVVVSGLKLSFIVAREVPELFQKISRLLAVLYTLSPSNKAFSMFTSYNTSLSESKWASYFHQASVGTHTNYQFPYLETQMNQKTMIVDGSFSSGSASLSLHSLAPKSVLELEAFILEYFRGLPRATIICLSMLGDAYASWLGDLLPCKPHTRAWVMFSRLNSDCAPFVVVLPIDSILAGSLKDNEDTSSDIIFDTNCSDDPWVCPWGRTITLVDEIAPLLRKILEENYVLSTKKCTSRDPKGNKKRKLDQRLCNLLRDMEDLWFGPWKHFLLGEMSDHKQTEFLQKKLVKDLKSMCKIDVDEDIIKAVVRGGVHQKECLSELMLKKGCYIGGRECSSLVSEALLNVMHEFGQEGSVDREPVILVTEFDLHMLPWESLPVLRNQEVYRMPSVFSILWTYDKCYHFREKDGKYSTLYPTIDPLDAYYLLNLGDNLREAKFGNWFKDKILKGTTGTSPSKNELSTALKDHDLFIYVGHGNGLQYIPGAEIQQLDRCAAALLLGCGSGSLLLNGSYIPNGAPLYYLSAGSPVIIATLWDVVHTEIGLFGEAVFNKWINTGHCSQCTITTNIDGEKKTKG
ncbi:hypothetical protein QVD17_01104 [Tagetes erecta]|uniref:separase n=1 Tax=Tagetes erecta TaxID=13708 RepID=A0AAD8L6E8_TARER|nr:hypothetical protein QVD17_01104 [Tagetes erecta]